MPSFELPTSQRFKSRIFNLEPCNRLREAVRLPGRAMQQGLDSEPSDDQSVTILHVALRHIRENTFNLPRKHQPVSRGSNEPPRSWGPFDIAESELVATFQVTTFFAVRRFQAQAGLKADGKAGAKTLRRLDEIEAHLDTTEFALDI